MVTGGVHLGRGGGVPTPVCQINRSTAAECNQFCMVLLRFLNLLLCSVGSGTFVRSCRHARFIVCIVQCCLGLPTLFFRPMFGRPFVPLKVACRVGAFGSSRSMCISRMCCLSLMYVDILGIRLGGGSCVSLCLSFPLPFFSLA